MWKVGRFGAAAVGQGTFAGCTPEQDLCGKSLLLVRLAEKCSSEGFGEFGDVDLKCSEKLELVH